MARRGRPGATSRLIAVPRGSARRKASAGGWAAHQKTMRAEAHQARHQQEDAQDHRRDLHRPVPASHGKPGLANPRFPATGPRTMRMNRSGWSRFARITLSSKPKRSSALIAPDRRAARANSPPCAAFQGTTLRRPGYSVTTQPSSACRRHIFGWYALASSGPRPICCR